MTRQEVSSPGESEVLGREVERQLARALEGLPNTIPVILFTQLGKNDIFNQAAREIIRTFRNLSNKILFREFDLSHEKARQYGVTASPTILFDPDNYNIRYLGAPFGEESRTLLGTLILLGLRASNLNNQSLKVMERIDSPRHVRLFVSATCPYCPDQALNAIKAAIEKPDLISLEIVDIQANTELATQYNAFGVPQTFANDVLIAQGAQTEELFVLSLQKLEPQTVFIPDSDVELVETDVVIVGGGPAGLTAGIYTTRSGLRTVVVERGALGGQVATTPIVENYPGFARVAGKTLVDIMVSHALEYVQIFQGEEVLDIQRGDPMTVLTSRRKFLARAVILATGATYKHLGVPGESRLAGRGVSYCATCDGSLFRGKRVVVVGGGNSAVTEALYLQNVGAEVTIVHRRDSLRAQEHLSRNIWSNNIPVLWDTEVREIRGQERVGEVVLENNRTGEKKTMPADGVFIAIGYNPTADLAMKVGVEITPEGFIAHDSHHRTNVPGIYSAGDVEGGYKQIVTAMGMGTEAALSVYEDLAHPYWVDETLLAAAQAVRRA